MFKEDIYMVDLTKSHSHVLCKCMNSRELGRVDQIDGEMSNCISINTCTCIRNLTFLTEFNQCLVNFGAGIDGVECREDAKDKDR